MPLPFIIAGVMLVGSLLGAKKLAATALAVDQYNKRKGYKKGEGPLTRREGDFGILIDENSISDLGQFLFVAGEFKLELKTWRGVLLRITKSEGASLRRLAGPAKAIRKKRVETLAFLRSAEARRDEVHAAIEAVKDTIEGEIKPAIEWLMEVPEEGRTPEMKAELARLQGELAVFNALELECKNLNIQVGMATPLVAEYEADFIAALDPILLWLEEFSKSRVSACPEVVAKKMRQAA